MGYRGRGDVPISGRLYTGGAARGLPWPDVPKSEIERILGKVHISLYNEREAAHEYEAWLRGEVYTYYTPETDSDGYVILGKQNGRPAAPCPREPGPIKC